MEFEPTDYEDLKVVRDCASDLNSKISDLGRGKRVREALDRIIEEAGKAAPLSEGWYLSSVSSVAQQVVYVKNGQVCRWSDGSGRIGSVAELRDQLTPFPSSGISAYNIDQVAERLRVVLGGMSPKILWDCLDEDAKEYYRKLARAALGV